MNATATLDNSASKIKLSAERALQIACNMIVLLPVCSGFTDKEIGRTKDDLFNLLKIHYGYSIEELDFVFNCLYPNIIGTSENDKIEKHFLYFWK